MNYLDELNASQREAVTYIDGPSLVIAGAGSGKTRVLVSKITYLIEQGWNPWNILALTFTNKAAREMKERIALQVGPGRASQIWAGTFHSIFSRILRREASLIGFTPNFTIYDTSDQKSLLKSIIKEMGLDEKKYKPGSVLGEISNAKNRLLTPSDYASDAALCEADRAAGIPRTADVYRVYWERLRQSNAMDFDDLLLYTYFLLRDNDEVRRRYADSFRFVLVDEYQDTNFAQHSIVWLLTKESQRICVVGDDAQSIYSFRGANIDNILNFRQTYTDAHLYKLQQNYRSTKTIVNASNSLINKNERQITKEVFSDNEEGDRIKVFKNLTDKLEGERVSQKILDLHTTFGVRYSDLAVLYRTNAQSRIFEESLRKLTIPYRIYGGLSFYQRKEVKDAIAYFRLTINPYDDEALRRVINYPARGIGETTLRKVRDAAASGGVSMWDVLCDPLRYQLTVNKGTHAKLQDFRDVMKGFMDQLDTADAYTLAQSVIKQSGIGADLASDKSPEGLARQENIDELMSAIYSFVEQRRNDEPETIVSLVDFLSEVSLLTDADEGADDDLDKVTLMTVHSAKGLEFDTVFVVGMEENLFPSQMSGTSQRELEEERRLFYVALTRAKKRCFLSYASSRFRYGKTEFASPSRFLREIDPQYLDGYPEGGVRRAAPQPSVQPRVPLSQPRTLRPLSRVSHAPVSSAGSSAAHSLQPDTLIVHERFGRGRVVRVEGSGADEKATIAFESAGQKQLLLKYAKFKVVE